MILFYYWSLSKIAIILLVIVSLYPVTSNMNQLTSIYSALASTYV